MYQVVCQRVAHQPHLVVQQVQEAHHVIRHRIVQLIVHLVQIHLHQNVIIGGKRQLRNLIQPVIFHRHLMHLDMD
jgi:hypothetical protein